MSRRRSHSRYANGRRVIFGSIHYSYADWGDMAVGTARPREMVLHTELPEMGSDMKPVYFQPEEHNGRRERRAQEIQAERARMAPIADRRGIRASAAAALLGAVMVLMLGVFLAGRIRIGAQNTRVARLESRIANADAEYESLMSRYESAMDHLNVGMIAVDQGMISAKGSKSVKIRVPENMCVTPCAVSGSNSGK